MKEINGNFFPSGSRGVMDIDKNSSTFNGHFCGKFYKYFSSSKGETQMVMIQH